MNYEILYRGAFAMLKVNLAAGESVKAESGAMVAKSPSVELESKMEGGLLQGLTRKLAGESMYMQSLTSKDGPGEVLLSPTSLGEIMAIPMNAEPFLVQKDGFLAGSPELDVAATAQGVSKGFFSGEGFFILRVSGSGMLFVSSYGAIHPLQVPPGEEVIVDNGHLVAWPESMPYSLEKATKGLFATITSGEGLVCRFRGPGTVYIQSRNPRGFAQWISRFLSKGS